MSDPIEYTEEQLNYFRICFVTTDVLTEGLRKIFKQEWDNRYKSTLGEWEDEPRNGLDFWNKESPRNRKRNGHLLTTMMKGDRAEWDCTMLFYAILYSDCISDLDQTIRRNVNNLRVFRNLDFAHMPKGHLSEPEFNNAISRVYTAFEALGLSSSKNQVQKLRNQKSFPTEELGRVLKKVEDLKQELQKKEDELRVFKQQLNSEAPPFFFFPFKPSHTVAWRDSEIAQITQQLEELKNANENNLSYLYISGDSGSGKSQLARVVAMLFDEDQRQKTVHQSIEDSPSATSFVMTLNAENSETLLQSYVTFARRLKCPEYAVTKAVTSKDLSTHEKIFNLNSLIGMKIERYTSWLLVVDNVTDLNTVSVYLPDPGNEQWAKGQILITTQDTARIPLTSSFTQHISVRKGMSPRDASCLLARLSDITDSEMENEVAEALHYQPLALANAASYVRRARQNKLTSGFGWRHYLKKLDPGKRSSPEAKRAKTDPSYRKPSATTLAVEQAMRDDRVIGHTFNFLSLCSPQPLHRNIVMNYVLKVDKEFQDEEMIKMRIETCPLLLFEEEESGDYIRVHHVVRDAINSVARDFTENGQRKVVVAIEFFTQFLKDENTCDPREKLYSLANSKHIVPHLVTLIRNVAHLFTEEGVCQVAEFTMSDYVHFSSNLQKLGRICQKHCEFEAAKDYFDRALAILLEKLGRENVEVASAYHTLGILYKRLGDLKEAEDYFHLALAIRMKKLGPKHVDVASSHNQLGELYRHLGNLMIAKDYLDCALDIRLEKLGPANVDVAATYTNLGSVHTQLDDPKEATKYFDLALNIQVEKLGTEHVEVATTCTNLGNAHIALRDLKQAKDNYDRALDIKFEKLGPEHVEVATLYNNLAYVHEKQGDLKQAKDYYDRALAIWLEKLGPEHDNVKRVRRNLARLQAQEESRSPPDADV